MNKYWTIIVCMLLFTSCRSKAGQEDKDDTGSATKVDMMEADRNFSLLSQKKGLRTAYSEYIDSNGVLLRPGYTPMAGADALDYIIQSNDSDFVMTWDPKDASISSSGDLGYTYGVYSLKPKDADTIIYGSYVTVWRKQPDGKWKFVLQSGNEGLESTAE